MIAYSQPQSLSANYFIDLTDEVKESDMTMINAYHKLLFLPNALFAEENDSGFEYKAHGVQL